MKIELIQATERPIETIANIASICYGEQEVKEPIKLVKHLYKNGHHSVFEHIYFTWKIESISRVCLAQLTRHRHCSFTVRSQRYCEETEKELIVPMDIIENDVHFLRWIETQAEIHKSYKILLEGGVKKEDARFILSQGIATDLYLSCNLRELIHISNERLCDRAQWEIKDLVKEMINLVDDDLKFMLTKKCETGRLICNERCIK